MNAVVDEDEGGGDGAGDKMNEMSIRRSIMFGMGNLLPRLWTIMSGKNRTRLIVHGARVFKSLADSRI